MRAGGAPFPSRPSQKVGRAVPSAPREAAQTRAFPTSSDARGALGTARPTPDPFRHRAFSLIEMIGVLAVIAIIAVAVLPALVQRINYAAQTTEAANLSALAAGLTQASSRQRYIPSSSPADWATFIATNIGWQVNTVLTNAVNNQRVLLIDPNLVIGTTIPNPAALPYVQANLGSGASLPPSARFIILSSLCISPTHRPAGRSQQRGSGAAPTLTPSGTTLTIPSQPAPVGIGTPGKVTALTSESSASTWRHRSISSR